MKRTLSKTLFVINAVIITVIFILNYFYQSNGFDFTLKCICSGSFAFLGIINLCYGLIAKQKDRKFYIGMTLGLIIAFLGDVLINYDFIIGAATFAIGHIYFIIAYCFIQKPKKSDFFISGILFLFCSAFLLICPLLTFEIPLLRIVCIIYALIISTMLGKAIGNFIKNKNITTGTIVIASSLFFISDLMLVLDKFIGLWNWTDYACMGTYYPALCLLALSMFLKTKNTKQIY